jgi:galactokinase
MSVDHGLLTAAFERRYGRPAELISEAPGRVNLIGEHTDYNGGFVLPAAIGRTVAVAAGAADGGVIRAYARDYDESAEFRTSEIVRMKEGGWRNYVRGVARELAAETGGLAGAELAISGDVPRGAGLSSSAALEVAVAGALAAVAGVEIEARDLALLAQRAENKFVGVQCGIMDQFAAALGRRGHALLIDCRSLEVEHVPLGFEERGAAIVIVDSGVPRRLEDTAYNRRREECAEAARLLGVASLREIESRRLQEEGDRLPEDLRKRAAHVVGENGRVLAAAAALRAGGLEAFGQAMYESHESLRDRFEVSTPELDLLVELARGTEGVLGARLTGAGFGGCTVNLVRETGLERFQHSVVEAYRARTGLEARVYVCGARDGLRVGRA